MKRYSFGFAVGAATAALVSGAVFAAVIPFPEEDSPANHAREAFTVLVIATLFCGGFIGAGAFNAEAFREVLVRVGIVCAAIVGLCFLASLDMRETGTMLVFALVGIFSSSVVSFLLGRRFPEASVQHVDLAE